MTSASGQSSRAVISTRLPKTSASRSVRACLSMVQRWVRLLGLDATVTSHVEMITTDVIKVEIIRLDAELAGHDPDGGTNAHPARQLGTRRNPPPKNKIRNRGEDHQI